MSPKEFYSLYGVSNEGPEHEDGPWASGWEYRGGKEGPYQRIQFLEDYTQVLKEELKSSKKRSSKKTT